MRAKRRGGGPSGAHDDVVVAGLDHVRAFGLAAPLADALDFIKASLVEAAAVAPPVRPPPSMSPPKAVRLHARARGLGLSIVVRPVSPPRRGRSSKRKGSP